MATKALTAEKPATLNGTGKSIMDAIRERSRLRENIVYVQRWEMEVTIRELTNADMGILRAAVQGKEDNDVEAQNEVGALLISLSCIEPVFTKQGVLDLLTSPDIAQEPFDFLALEIRKLNKMGDEGAKAADATFPDKKKS